MFKSKDETLQCPLLKGACIKEKCMWWTHIRGKDPQGGKDLDFPDCAVKWLPTLLLENSKETRQAAAAIETMRNENVGGAQLLLKMLQQAAEQKLLKN